MLLTQIDSLQNDEILRDPIMVVFFSVPFKCCMCYEHIAGI